MVGVWLTRPAVVCALASAWQKGVAPPARELHWMGAWPSKTKVRLALPGSFQSDPAGGRRLGGGIRRHQEG